VSPPHFFVETLEPGRVLLTDEDSRHALRSLRLRPGDRLSLADGQGAVAEGGLTAEVAGRAAIDVAAVRRVERSSPALSMAVAPPKGERLAWAVQKLGELGVDELVLVRADHSVRAWKGEGAANRTVSRLRAVAREAAMQSRRPFVMEVREPVSLTDAIEARGADVVALWEGAPEPLLAGLPLETPAVRIVVGPEGGFSDREVQAMRGGGAVLASLGPGILRTETAAIVGAAVVLARYGRLG